jgi:hypothetical protein
MARKYQTTIPRDIRKYLMANGLMVNPSSMVVVDSHKKMDDPVKFLTSQIEKSRIDLDAVKLINETREEFV